MHRHLPTWVPPSVQRSLGPVSTALWIPTLPLCGCCVFNSGIGLKTTSYCKVSAMFVAKLYPRPFSRSSLSQPFFPYLLSCLSPRISHFQLLSLLSQLRMGDLQARFCSSGGTVREVGIWKALLASERSQDRKRIVTHFDCRKRILMTTMLGLFGSKVILPSAVIPSFLFLPSPKTHLTVHCLYFYSFEILPSKHSYTCLHKFTLHYFCTLPQSWLANN